MDRTSKMKCKGATVEIPGKIAEGKGHRQGRGWLDTKHGKNNREKDRAATQEMQRVRATLAAEPTRKVGGKTRADAPGIKPCGNKVQKKERDEYGGPQR